MAAAQVRRPSTKDPRPAPATGMGSMGPKPTELTYVPRAGVIFWSQVPLETPASQFMGKKVNGSEPISTACELNTFLCFDIRARSRIPFMTRSFVSNLPLAGFRQGRALDSPHHHGPLSQSVSLFFINYICYNQVLSTVTAYIRTASKYVFPLIRHSSQSPWDFYLVYLTPKNFCSEV